jgi:MYXO-CTERM domain-containing protein
VTPPVCVCKGQNGCQPPCFGVSCDPGSTCLSFGPNAGQCGQDDCTISPCPGCGKVCFGGTCIDGPCNAASCAPTEVCKPSADFTSFECVGTCADVDCPAGQKCKEGQCAPTCDPACPAGSYCDESTNPPTCTSDPCASVTCGGTTCCDHATGQCGNCPCDGVLCPGEQVCKDGECVGDTGGGGSGGGSSSSTTASSSGSGAAGPTTEDRHVWGLATGGGGCSCRVGDEPRGGESALGLAFGLALLGASRRVTRRRQRAAAEGRAQ